MAKDTTDHSIEAFRAAERLMQKAKEEDDEELEELMKRVFNKLLYERTIL